MTAMRAAQALAAAAILAFFLDVPVEDRRRRNDVRELLAVDDRRPVHAKWDEGHVLQVESLQLVDERTVFGRIALQRPLPSEINDALITGPMVPSSLAVLHKIMNQRIGYTGG